MAELTGKVAIVVGASGANNFGVASARLLSENGAKVVVAARQLAKANWWSGSFERRETVSNP
ncbi:MAG: hypothetical protein ACE363_04755 [Alphaproteobacteria bacterium]